MGTWGYSFAVLQSESELQKICVDQIHCPTNKISRETRFVRILSLRLLSRDERPILLALCLSAYHRSREPCSSAEAVTPMMAPGSVRPDLLIARMRCSLGIQGGAVIKCHH